MSCTEDADGGTRFRAQECTRRFNKKLNLRGHSMLHLSTPKISLLEALKNAQKCKEKDAFYAD